MSSATVFGTVDSNDQAWRLVEHYFEPLLPFYREPTVTEIMVNRFDTIFVQRQGTGMELTSAKFADEMALVTAIEQLANALNQVVTAGMPILHARFPDQSRACATLKEGCSPAGSTLTIRRVAPEHFTLQDLLRLQSLNADMLAYLQTAVEEGANILVAGGTESGKTTLLRALTRFIPTTERVITCEDTRELDLYWLPNSINHEAPKRRIGQGDDTIDLSTLILTTLRERPDRIIVGEIRDAGAADAFVQATNTGHSGCMTSVHANSAALALKRLQYLIASQGSISYELAGETLLGDLNIVIHVAKKTGIGKKIMEIAEVIDGELVPLFKFDRSSAVHESQAGTARSAYIALAK